MIEPVDLAESARFLALLDESTDVFTFQSFDDDSERKSRSLARTLHGTLTERAQALAALSARGAGVFVTVNETDGSGRRKAENVARVRALFADADGAPLEPIMACGLEPHVVVESSPNRWHVYWLVDDLPLAEFADLQRVIAAKFGTDPSVHDLPRVLRLPGFDHRKNASHRVRIIHESGAIPYCAQRVRAAFALAGAVALAPSPAAPVHEAQVHVEPATIADLRSALAHLRADDYADWIAVGCALRELDGVGRGLWIEWSQGSPKWRATDTWTWDTLPHDRTGYAAVFAKAQRAGWVNPRAGNASVPAHSQSSRGEASPLVPVEVGDLSTATIEPPQFVVAAIIPRSHVTLLGGHGGTGKSQLALGIAACVASGSPWAGLSVAQGRALFVSLEDPAALVRWRLRAIASAYELDVTALARNLLIFDGTDGKAGVLAREAFVNGVSVLEPTASMHQLCEVATGATLIVVDNASDAYEANESDRAKVRAFVRQMLGGIARANHAALLLLAHIDKQAARFGSAGNTYSGSTAWHNSARSRLALVESDGAIELRHEKANLCRRIEPMRLRFTDSGVLLPCAAGECAAADGGAALVEQGDAEALYATLLAASAQGVRVPTGRTGPATAQHVLSTMPELPPALRGAKGRPRFWAAMGRLQRSGRAGSEDYVDSSRHRRQHLVARVLA